MAVEIPNYSEYSLIELYQTLNSVRGDLYPQVLEALENEIRGRQPESVFELRDCYFALDRDDHPEFAEQILQQIEAMGGVPKEATDAITEDNRYKTFWRRFWAGFLDGLLLLIPSMIFAVAMSGAGLETALASPVFDLGASILAIVYVVFMHARYGQTLGKMAVGVKVVRVNDEGPLSIARATLRNFVAVGYFVLAVVAMFIVETPGVDAEEAVEPPMALVVIGAAWMAVGAANVITAIINRRRRALHDLVAKTIVIRIPKRQK